jgi:energy-coupling factor transport system permease protein
MSTNFETLRNITIGQYIPGESPIHRMDARFKLVATGVLILAITAGSTVVSALLAVAFLLAVTLLARISMPYILRGLIPAAGFLVLIVVFQLLFQGPNVACSEMWFEWHFVQISPCLVRVLTLGLIRVVAFLFLVSLLTMTTTASRLTHGAEALMAPLSRVGFPGHEIALAMTVALRFVPTLAEEMDRITKAQASRGASIGEAPWWRPDRIIRERLPLLVPLFVNALRRAEELVTAMESRAYIGDKGRTTFVHFKAAAIDWLFLGACVALWLAFWLLPWGAWAQLGLAG